MSVVTIMMGSEKDMDFANKIITKLNEFNIEITILFVRLIKIRCRCYIIFPN